VFTHWVLLFPLLLPDFLGPSRAALKKGVAKGRHPLFFTPIPPLFGARQCISAGHAMSAPLYYMVYAHTNI